MSHLPIYYESKALSLKTLPCFGDRACLTYLFMTIFLILLWKGSYFSAD